MSLVLSWKALRAKKMNTLVRITEEVECIQIFEKPSYLIAFLIVLGAQASQINAFMFIKMYGGYSIIQEQIGNVIWR